MIDDLQPGNYVELTVIDDGLGMDAATLARASEPFFTTKGVGKGTGLGLSMIHGYARQLGGALVLESEVGVGTKAHLWLPAGKSEPRVETARAAPETVPGVMPQTILAVDDDVLVLMNTAALLEDLGHNPIEASSGSEALTLLDRHPEIGLLVTDQAMPGMTGSQLIAAVRQHRPDLPIILASGYGETPADGMEGIIRLGKPFNQRDLQRALAAALR
jgi:CheY-like chemotaxis protein